MATLYINPQAATDGDGSEATPYNTLIGKTLATGNSYLFKCGSIYTPGTGTEAIACTQSTVTVSSYGSGTRPIINCAGINRGVTISNDIANITISGLRITGVNTSTNIRGITNSTTGSSGSVVTNILISNCEIDNIASDAANDCLAIQLWGQGNEVRNCVIHDIATDGIWMLGQFLKINGCTIYNCSNDGRGQGDCIQIGGASDGFEVVGNYLDHTGLTAKQAFIVDNATGVGGLVAYNTVYESNNSNCVGIYAGQPSMIVRGNKVTGGVVCMNSTRAGIRLEGNLCFNSFSRGIDVGSNGVTCINNTVVGGQQTSGIGIRYQTAGSTATIKNNIVASFPTGLSLAASAYDEDYNNIYDCATASNRALGANTTQLNPQFDGGYRATNTTLRTSGIGLGGNDFFGKDFGYPPSIGHIQYLSAAFSVASRSVVTRSVTSRSIRTRTGTTG